MTKKQTKTCLLVTYGPVPTSEYQTIEGGGMRVWGLAKGLQENGINVTIGVNDSFPQNILEYDGVKLANWSLDDQFIELINSFDSVVISYCMGDPSIFVAKNINDNIQLILDLYVPIYVEVSARDSENIEQEFKNYIQDINKHNDTLKRGDYFLCASQNQKIYYTGVLSSLGIINPRSYRSNRLLVVPFGIHRHLASKTIDPYLELGITKKQKRILWFGGMYPWFRINEFLAAVKLLTENDPTYTFIIVGAKNPFNPNPDFSKQYETAYSFFQKNHLLDKNVFFVDWVDFDTRINWYKHADFVISINQPGEENIFSWRTRVMDYVWGEIITLTNGEDTLSEDLVSNGAALKLKDLSKESMVEAIMQIYATPDLLRKKRDALIKLKESYYWENVTKILSETILLSNLPWVDEMQFKHKVKFATQVNPDSYSAPMRGTTYFAKAKKAIRLTPKAYSYAKRKGIKESSKLAISTIKNQSKKKILPRKKQYIFLSHPIDNSGAPMVLIQIIEDLVKNKPEIRKQIRIIAPYILKNRQTDIRKIGVKSEKAVHGLGGSLTGAQLSLKLSDFVLINTVAVFDNYRNYIFNSLGANKLKHAYWFIHEDIEQCRVVAPQILAKENIDRIQRLVKSNKLTILVPSNQVKEDYNKVFGISSVRQVDLRIDIDKKYLKQKSSSSYKKINFLLSGAASDGRKGQLIALAAFQRYMLVHYANDPSSYRDFSLHLIGVNEDYVSTQIKSIGKSILNNKLYIYPSIPREKALAITSTCNAVICCSLNETFGLYVAEGMAMGHIVLRNKSAGVDEQLIDGVNGLLINDEDIVQFSNSIEYILNKNTDNETLAKMGLESQKLSKKFLDQNYTNQITLT